MESRPPYPPPGGQPPPGAYPPPGYGAHPGYAPQVTNGKAVAALVAGIVAWVMLPVLAAIAAVILGSMAREEIKNDPYQTGDGMAVAGLILGWIQIGLALLALIVFVIILVFVWGIIGAAHMFVP